MPYPKKKKKMRSLSLLVTWMAGRSSTLTLRTMLRVVIA
jgi:hypothetical protein